MTTIHGKPWPTVELDEWSEQDTKGKLVFPYLFKPLGFPSLSAVPASLEWYQENRSISASQKAAGKNQYDGCFVVQGKPVVLVELKKVSLNRAEDWAKTAEQAEKYCRSPDFVTRPPYFVSTNGRDWGAGSAFYFYDKAADAYKPTPPMEWAEIVKRGLFGEYAPRLAEMARIAETLIKLSTQFENEMRIQLNNWIASKEDSAEVKSVKSLVAEKDAEFVQMSGDRRARTEAVKDEILTQAALNFLNKVLFLAIIEDRYPNGFFRIVKEFIPNTLPKATATTAMTFMTLMKKRALDAGGWTETDESAYQKARADLVVSVKDDLLNKHTIFDFLRAGFLLAAEQFPTLYHASVYDQFSPDDGSLRVLLNELANTDFRAVTGEDMGNIYEEVLHAKRQRQRQLGSYYTPSKTVRFMLSRLELRRDSRVLEPCSGSGHIVEMALDELLRIAKEDYGEDLGKAYPRIVNECLFACDIDPFAVQLTAMRMLFKSLGLEGVRNIHAYATDTLLYPVLPGVSEAMMYDEHMTITWSPLPQMVALGNQELQSHRQLNQLSFDAVVGNPPYGGKPTPGRRSVYHKLYNADAKVQGAKPVPGLRIDDGETYALFIVNAIARLRHGGRMSFICSDSFRTVASHESLRRLVLDRCKVVELVTAPPRIFSFGNFGYAGKCILTLEKWTGEPEPGEILAKDDLDKRRKEAALERERNQMRLVTRLDTEDDYPGIWDITLASDPRVEFRTQRDFLKTPGSKFFMHVPEPIVDIFDRIGQGKDRTLATAGIEGKQGLATADDKLFTALLDRTQAGHRSVTVAEICRRPLTAHEKADGIADAEPHFVPYAKGEGYQRYSSKETDYLDWGQSAVKELKRRAAFKPNTPKRPRLQNQAYYFRPGVTYSTITYGGISARLLPEGAVFGHKGSTLFPKPDDASFLLGYLNSQLATYFLRQMINHTETADVGYILALPWRDPPPPIRSRVEAAVAEILTRQKADLNAEISDCQSKVDDSVFELYGFPASKDHGIRREVSEFYDHLHRKAAVGPAQVKAQSDDSGSEETVSSSAVIDPALPSNVP